MPATSYERGIRESKLMEKNKIREGMEDDDDMESMDSGKRMKKGSCSCDNKGSCKCKKKNKKRRDAVLTPLTVRVDIGPTGQKGKKCGNSYIPANAICRQGGAGGAVAPSAPGGGRKRLPNHGEFMKQKASLRGTKNKIKRVGEYAANTGARALALSGGVQTALGIGQSVFQIPVPNRGASKIGRGLSQIALSRSVGQVAKASKASRMGDKELKREFLKSAGRNVGYAGLAEVGGGAIEGVDRAGGAKVVGERMRRRAGRATRSAYNTARSAYNTAWQRAGGVRVTPEARKSLPGTRRKRKRKARAWNDPRGAYTTTARTIRDSIFMPGINFEQFAF